MVEKKKSHHSWPASWQHDDNYKSLKFRTLREQSYFSVMPRLICHFTCSRRWHRPDIRLIHRKQNTVQVWLKTSQRALPLLLQCLVEKVGKIYSDILLLTSTKLHKIHLPNNNLIWKCHLKLYSATMKAHFYACKYAYNLTL